jgi:hypothetical protein
VETEICSDAPRRRKVKLLEATKAGALSGQVDIPSEQEAEQQAPGSDKVMVRVVRVCANPRVVLCEYNEGGVERRVLVRVGRNANFIRGMEFEAQRGRKPGELWGYEGRLPRFRGRW